ncbi:MAG: fimbrillin family protein, partial [Tannerellaceae bacterium]
MEGKDNANDLMLAYCASHKFADRKTAANLPFEHKMAKVTLNLIAGVTGNDKFDLSTINSVVLNQFPNAVTVNLGTRVVTPNTANKANITPFLEETITTPTATKIYTAIVAPGSIGGTSVKIATITTTTGHTYNVTVNKAYTLAAGKNNIFNITLNKSDVAVSATIKSWETNKIEIAETVQLVKITVGAITETKITEGSTLGLKIVDAANKTHSVTFTATTKAESSTTALYWVQNDSKLYWDDITFPSDGKGELKVDGVLKIKSTDKKPVEEYLYAGTTNITKAIITGTGTGEGTGTISFTKMEHPLCKLNITITTTTTTGTDWVDLTKMTSIVLPNYPYSVYNMNTVPVSGTNTVADITVKKITDPASDPYKYTVYIFPQTIKAGSSLIDVTVTNEALSNVYQLKTAADQVFAANTIYGITMTLKKTEIASNGKVTLVNWDTQGTISGDGTITE